MGLWSNQPASMRRVPGPSRGAAGRSFAAVGPTSNLDSRVECDQSLDADQAVGPLGTARITGVALCLPLPPAPLASVFLGFRSAKMLPVLLRSLLVRCASLAEGDRNRLPATLDLLSARAGTKLAMPVFVHDAFDGLLLGFGFARRHCSTPFYVRGQKRRFEETVPNRKRRKALVTDYRYRPIKRARRRTREFL